MEFRLKKIEGTLKRANTEPYMAFNRANTNSLWLLGRLIRNCMCILGGPIQKPLKKKTVNLRKRVVKDGAVFGLDGLLLGISLGLHPWEIAQSSPASKPLENPVLPLLFYLE